jgi:hypothetical protein
MRKIFTCLIEMFILTFAVISAVAATDMSPSREMVTVIAMQNQMQATTLSTQTSSQAVLVSNESAISITGDQFATVLEVRPPLKSTTVTVAQVVANAEIPEPAAQKLEGTAYATLIVSMPAEYLEVAGEQTSRVIIS